MSANQGLVHIEKDSQNLKQHADVAIGFADKSVSF